MDSEDSIGLLHAQSTGLLLPQDLAGRNHPLLRDRHRMEVNDLSRYHSWSMPGKAYYQVILYSFMKDIFEK